MLPQRYKFSSKSQPAMVTLFAPNGCCCYRKGTNFQANHNCISWPKPANCVVVATAKVQIFKQITTHGRNLQTALSVVVATAKVQIFKQITTFHQYLSGLVQLLLLPQRYKFSSKSQHLRLYQAVRPRCCCYRKGTNFQANHNRLLFLVVLCLLLLLPQRYKFSSKSQRRLVCAAREAVVVATAKVQIFKQITTKLLVIILICSCCCYRKGTNFQANHNLTLGVDIIIVLLLLPQRYKFSSKSQLCP